MDLTQVIVSFLGFLGLLVTGYLGYRYSTRLLERQAQVNKDAQQAEIEKKRAEIEQIIDARWQMLTDALTRRNDELEGLVKKYEEAAKLRESERNLMIQNLDEVNGRVEQLEADCIKKDRLLEIANVKIKELEFKVKGIEKKTGPLPDLPQDKNGV